MQSGPLIRTSWSLLSATPEGQVWKLPTWTETVGIKPCNRTPTYQSTNWPDKLELPAGWWLNSADSEIGSIREGLQSMASWSFPDRKRSGVSGPKSVTVLIWVIAAKWAGPLSLVISSSESV